MSLSLEIPHSTWKKTITRNGNNASERTEDFIASSSWKKYLQAAYEWAAEKTIDVML